MRVECKTALYPHFFEKNRKLPKISNSFQNRYSPLYQEKQTKIKIMKRIYLLTMSIIALLSLTSCEMYDEYGEMIIRTKTDNITQAVAGLYPQARIVEMDNDFKTIEVEIVDNDTRRDVYFDLSLNWLRTETDIRHADLPAEVANKIASKYAGWFIDDIKAIDTPQGSYYLVELDKGEREKRVKIDASGNVL